MLPVKSIEKLIIMLFFSEVFSMKPACFLAAVTSKCVCLPDNVMIFLLCSRIPICILVSYYFGIKTSPQLDKNVKYHGTADTFAGYKGNYLIIFSVAL